MLAVDVLSNSRTRQLCGDSSQFMIASTTTPPRPFNTAERPRKVPITLYNRDGHLFSLKSHVGF